MPSHRIGPAPRIPDLGGRRRSRAAEGHLTPTLSRPILGRDEQRGGEGKEPAMTVKTTFGYVGLEEFAAELDQASLDVPGSMGRPLLPPIEDQIRPHLWRWAD